jgi:hypothetical protein
MRDETPQAKPRGRTPERPPGPWWAAALLLWLIPAGIQAAEVAQETAVPPPEPGEARVVLVREARFVGSGRTMFVYAGERFLGTLDNGTWTHAGLPPGDYTLWLNWAKVTHQASLEPDRTHYFTMLPTGFLEVDEATGQALLAAQKGLATPTPKEEQTAQDHIRDRYGKAQQAAAKAPAARPATGKGERNRHVEKWPRVDLSAYSTLYIEDFAMADPKAAERSKEHLVATAPGRLAAQVAQSVPDDLFDKVLRGAPEEPVAGALVLRGEITQYKPGSAMARGMIAGAGAARMDFAVRLIDAASGAEVAGFADERSYSWGGVMGAAGGIETIEQNVAYELALYLARGKGREM